MKISQTKFISFGEARWGFIIILLFISTSCINQWDKWLDTNYIEYEIVDQSKLFKQGYMDIKLVEYDNNLSVELETKLPRSFEFPKSEFDQKPLTNTKFYFKFYANGKPLKVDNKIFSSKISVVDNDGNLSFITGIKDVRHSSKYKLSIPMFAFHNLPNGEQEIEMEVYQKHFQNSVEYNAETESYSEKEFKNITLIKGKIKFKINVPKLYITQICNDSIILRDDNTFTPYGMDVAFLKKGLPDIYWELDYYKSKETSEFKSFTSPVQDYATMYTYRDTVNFYHYDDTEGIKLSVWDKDDFNRDDFISSKSVKFSNLKSENNDYVNLKFDNIAKFKIKILNDKILIN